MNAWLWLPQEKISSSTLDWERAKWIGFGTLGFCLHLGDRFQYGNEVYACQNIHVKVGKPLGFAQGANDGYAPPADVAMGTQLCLSNNY